MSPTTSGTFDIVRYVAYEEHLLDTMQMHDKDQDPSEIQEMIVPGDGRAVSTHLGGDLGARHRLS